VTGKSTKYNEPSTKYLKGVRGEKSTKYDEPSTKYMKGISFEVKETYPCHVDQREISFIGRKLGSMEGERYEV